MNRSTNKRGIFLLSLFILSFIIQSFAAYNFSNCKQLHDSNHFSDYIPYKNKTNYNLQTGFIEEESEDDNDSESNTADFHLIQSQFDHDFLKNCNQNKFNSKISFLKDIPLYINIHNLRI